MVRAPLPGAAAAEHAHSLEPRFHHRYLLHLLELVLFFFLFFCCRRFSSIFSMASPVWSSEVPWMRGRTSYVYIALDSIEDAHFILFYSYPIFMKESKPAREGRKKKMCRFLHRQCNVTLVRTFHHGLNPHVKQ